MTAATAIVALLVFSQAMNTHQATCTYTLQQYKMAISPYTTFLIYGGNLNSECSRLCDNDSSCKAYALDTYNNYCYLTTRTTPADASKRKYFALKICSTTPMPTTTQNTDICPYVLQQYMVIASYFGVWSIGSNLNSVCQELCDDYVTCQSYTIDYATNYCYLSSSDESRSDSSSQRYFGQRQCRVTMKDSFNFIISTMNSDPETESETKSGFLTTEPGFVLTTESDVPFSTDSDEPFSTESDVSFTTEPDVPLTTEPDVPFTTESDVPITTESDLPFSTELDLPFSTESDIAITTESDVPLTTEPDVPLTTESDAPITSESNLPFTTDLPFSTESDVSITTESDVPFTSESYVPLTTESDVLLTTEPDVPFTTESDVPITTEPTSFKNTEPGLPITTKPENQQTTEPDIFNTKSVKTSEQDISFTTEPEILLTTEPKLLSTKEKVTLQTETEAKMHSEQNTKEMDSGSSPSLEMLTTKFPNTFTSEAETVHPTESENILISKANFASSKSMDSITAESPTFTNTEALSTTDEETMEQKTFITRESGSVSHYKTLPTTETLSTDRIASQTTESEMPLTTETASFIKSDTSTTDSGTLVTTDILLPRNPEFSPKTESVTSMKTLTESVDLETTQLNSLSSSQTLSHFEQGSTSTAESETRTDPEQDIMSTSEQGTFLTMEPTVISTIAKETSTTESGLFSSTKQTHLSSKDPETPFSTDQGAFLSTEEGTLKTTEQASLLTVTEQLLTTEGENTTVYKSTTQEASNTPIQITNGTVNCICVCQYVSVSLEEIIHRRKRALMVNEGNLSSTVRKLTCAKDNRKSSTSMGTIGGVILSLIFGLIVLSDVYPVYLFLCKILKISSQDV